MRIEKIREHEAGFERSPTDTSGKRHALIRKAIEIAGEDAEMRYVDCKPADGDESYFYRTRPAKDQIVLHFTMGYLRGDVATLTKKDYHVSVPFLVARSGTIYNLFPSMYWSYHLGKGAVGGNSERSKASIGIELSNIGPLRRDGDRLLTSYSSAEKKDVYCLADQKDAYVEAPYRGWDSFATFTNAQYESLVVLLRYLTARYGIRRKFLPPSKRYATTEETAGFKGIVSHVNFRSRGKTDIGPAFEWDRVIGAVQA
jgi:N-acetylmuramoyl-L-alanine amidase